MHSPIQLFRPIIYCHFELHSIIIFLGKRFRQIRLDLENFIFFFFFICLDIEIGKIQIFRFIIKGKALLINKLILAFVSKIVRNGQRFVASKKRNFLIEFRRFYFFICRQWDYVKLMDSRFFINDFCKCF